jgi:CheY-like chemotaxis protein
VVVTAAADAAGRAAEVAADGHLPKPFDLDDLFRVIEQYAPAH